MRVDKTRLGGLGFMAAAFLTALLAAGLVISVAVKAAPTVPVLQVVQDIPPGTPPKEYVEATKLPAAGLPPDVLTPDTDLADTVVKHGLTAGDILRAGHLVAFGQPAGLLTARITALNDPLLRAMEVPVEAVAGMLAGMQAGDRVDLVAVLPLKDQKTGIETVVAKTVLQDVPVVGVRPPEDAGTGVLVVGVYPDQAEILALARTQGKLFVLLAPLNAATSENTQPGDVSELYTTLEQLLRGAKP